TGTASNPGFLDGFTSVTFSRNGTAVLIHQATHTANSFIASAVSIDGGVTWRASNVTAALDNGDIRPIVTSGPVLASPSGVPSPTDVFYATWANGKDIFSSFSTDGLTWSPASKINDTQPGASINAMISVAADGKIYAVWEDYQGP